MEYCCGLAKCLIPKCFGAGKEAKELWDEFMKDFGRHECEIETCYDQWMAYYALEHKVFASSEMTVPTVENYGGDALGETFAIVSLRPLKNPLNKKGTYVFLQKSKYFQCAKPAKKNDTRRNASMA